MVSNTNGNKIINKFQINKISIVIYLVAFLLLFVVPILVHFNPLIGQVPVIEKGTLTGKKIKIPEFIYFWAEWCGSCKKMQPTISHLLQEYQGITIAINSGNNQQLNRYLQYQQLNWDTINDEHSMIAKRYFVHAVPTFIVLNKNNEIAFISQGPTSEWVIRLQLWLAS